MKEKTKIVFWAALAVSMLVSSGSAFAGGNKAADSGGGQKPMDIEIFEGIGVILPSADQDPILQALQKKLNINLTMNTSLRSDDYRSQLNVRIAGGDMPDILWMPNRTDLVKHAKEGTILEITPYLNKLQPVVSYLGQDMTPGYVDGKLYAISKAPNIPYSYYNIRKDWLDALNLKVPETTGQFRDVAIKFANNDPDGNGVKDTVGLASGGYDAFTYLFGGYGIGQPKEIYVKDNKLVNSLFESDMPVVLNEIKSLIDAGGVDPELFTLTDSNKVQEKAIQGKIGFFYHDWTFPAKNMTLIKEVNPRADWIALGVPTGPRGTNYASSHSFYTSGLLSIAESLSRNPAKLEKVFEIFNYLSSTEGLRLASYGIEGAHYNMVNGKVVATDRMGPEGGYFWAYQLVGRTELEYLYTKFVGYEDLISFANDLPRLRNLMPFMLTPEGYNKADLDRYIDDEIIKFIYGRRPIADYPRFLTELENQFKISVYMKAYEEQAKSFGFIK
ncbi:lipoprotein LipO [Spirochaetia bacterium]|nr:lipoprotein LipO [Spirochaetia bacterium]